LNLGNIFRLRSRTRYRSPQPCCTLEPATTKQETTSPASKWRFWEDFGEILSAEEQEQSESTGQHGGTKRFKALFFAFLIKLTIKQNSQAFPSPSWFPLHTQQHTKQRPPTEKTETALSTTRHDEGRSLRMSVFEVKISRSVCVGLLFFF